MRMRKVVSSNIVAIGYKHKKLYVDFKNGSYVYYNVKKRIYRNMLRAESKGKFLHTEIKGKYLYERLES